MAKLVWRVAEKPTGRYRSFERRGWPSAHYDKADGEPAAWIYCEDEYIPRLLYNGQHRPLTVILCHHQHPALAGRSWKRMKKEGFKTLDEAKAWVKRFLDGHPEYAPKSS